MCPKIILMLCCLTWGGKAISASTFDQRQTGDLNVQVDLKDLHIIALMGGKRKEEYVDYDYAYDYSEMTIKPQNGTTPKPLNSTTATTDDGGKDNSTLAITATEEQTTLPTTAYNSSQSVEAEVTGHFAINDSTSTVRSLDGDRVEVTDTPDSTNIRNETSTPDPVPPHTTNCRKGFVMNYKGDCELKLQGTGNALLKLVRLSQKLKLRRENRRKQNENEHVIN